MGRNLGRQHQNPKPKIDEHSSKENRIKSCECAGIHSYRKEVAPHSQEFACSWDQQSTKFLVEIFMGMWSAILRCFNQWLELSDKKTDWLTRGQTELLPKTVGMRETIVQLLVSIPATRYLLA